jgi:hypothetical protein
MFQTVTRSDLEVGNDKPSVRHVPAVMLVIDRASLVWTMVGGSAARGPSLRCLMAWRS